HPRQHRCRCGRWSRRRRPADRQRRPRRGRRHRGAERVRWCRRPQRAAVRRAGGERVGSAPLP
ncbi:hypothetical protein TMIG_03835, partial [Mycobacterium tuberculosis SUMu009]